MPVLALSLGLAAAAVFAVTAVAQQQEAARLDTHGSSFFHDLAVRPRWWAATVGVGVGYGLQAAALAVGSILVVQPLLIVALVFALPLGARWNHRAVPPSDVTWAAAIAIAVAVFLVVGTPGVGVEAASLAHWLPSIVVCGVVTVVAGVLAFGDSARWRSLGLAVIAGTLFGVASVLTKSVAHHLGGGLIPALKAWETYALVGTGALGFVAQQLAFQAGSLEISLPAVTVLDPVMSVAVAMSALDERVQVHGLGWALIALSCVVMIVGTVALARAGVPAPTGARSVSDPAPAT